MAASYIGQIPFRVKGQTTCTHHKGILLELYCEDCNELVCLKCLSSLHKRHTLCDIKEFASKKKEDIEKFIEKTENDDLVQIDKNIIYTDKQLQNNTCDFEKRSHQLTTQTNKLKEELSRFQKMKEDNTKLLQTYKKDLEMCRTQLKEQVQECKIALQNDSYIQIYETGCEIQSPVRLPVTPPNQMNPTPLETMSDTKEKEGPSSTHQRSKRAQAVFNPCNITSVCPTTDGQVWTSQNRSDTLTLLDRKGKVIPKVTHNAMITDIYLSPTTNTLWICDLRNNILELVSERLVHRFSTTKLPHCICITSSNHVIVGMSEQISKFTTGGTSMRYTSLGDTGKPLVCTPYRISECPVTKNIAVADWDSEDDDGNGKKRVAILDTDFKELFVYDGKVPDTYQTSSHSGVKPFNPCIAVYDSVGNLIIGDCYNRNILLISGRGEFIRVIHTADSWIRAFGVDREDVMWAVFGSGNLKLIQCNKAI